MAGLMSNQGEEIIAKYIANKSPSAADTLVLRLYKNNYTPVDGSTESNFTEATFTDYAGILLSGANWTITPNAPTLMEYPQQTFICGDPPPDPAEFIYGYYLTQQNSGKYMWGEKFNDGPYPISLENDNVKVTAKLNIKKVGE